MGTAVHLHPMKHKRHRIIRGRFIRLRGSKSRSWFWKYFDLDLVVLNLEKTLLKIHQTAPDRLELRVEFDPMASVEGAIATARSEIFIAREGEHGQRHGD